MSTVQCTVLYLHLKLFRNNYLQPFIISWDYALLFGNSKLSYFSSPCPYLCCWFSVPCTLHASSYFLLVQAVQKCAKIDFSPANTMQGFPKDIYLFICLSFWLQFTFFLVPKSVIPPSSPPFPLQVSVFLDTGDITVGQGFRFHRQGWHHSWTGFPFS